MRLLLLLALWVFTDSQNPRLCGQNLRSEARDVCGPVTNAHNAGWRQPGKPTKQVVSVEGTQEAENEQRNVVEGA